MADADALRDATIPGVPVTPEPAPPPATAPPDGSVMSLVDHLGELRDRLFRVILGQFPVRTQAEKLILPSDISVLHREVIPSLPFHCSQLPLMEQAYRTPAFHISSQVACIGRSGSFVELSFEYQTI